ncbi:uncharacterized protein LOC117124127 [Anneissia japonica]|uniref:uncharacterized protein LOC117124127 n=1 Tax=Anneissia japonica TaxID=1529436 RepID=UPI0014259B8A|nr:uncharacterized protein LOC117124127 [Anneissia japonica]
MEFSWMCFLLVFFFTKSIYQASQKRIRRKYKRYGITAELPFNRAKVLIIGDAGAGKTSTRKRLCGDGFQEIMSRTEGIEITNVTRNWKKIRSSGDDFEKLASHVTIMEHFETENKFEPLSLHSRGEMFMHTHWYQRVLHAGLVIMPTILLNLFWPSVQISPINSVRLNFALPKALLYYQVCIMSGGISFFRMLKHLVIAIFASMIENTPFCGPLVGQVSYYVLILLLYDGIFVKIASSILVFYRGILLESVLIISRGILLGIALMIHQDLHELPIDQFSHQYQKFILNRQSEVFITFFVIEYLIRHFLICNFSNMAHTIYLMVFMVLIIVTKSNIVALSLELTVFLLQILYTYSWMNTHTIQLISLGRPLIFFLQMPHFFILLGSGVIIGILFSLIWVYFLITDFKMKILEDIISIVVFMALEIYLWMKGETDIPMSRLNVAVAEYEFGCSHDPPDDKRWIICDFAGQQIYYDTHHIFIPRQGVFLVVFDANKFIRNRNKNSRGIVERVQFWVQSVAIHANKENSVVFLIGTHKNCLNDEQCTILSKELEDELYSQYGRLLKFNTSTGRMVFFIENENEADPERAFLQMVIEEETNELPFVKKKWPIRYHLFQRIISSKRQLNKYVIKKSSLREDIVKQCKLEVELEGSEDELGKLAQEHGKSKKNIEEAKRIEVGNILAFFNRSGDIFYEPLKADNDDYVITDLQILVDVVRMLVNIPPRHERERAFAEQWDVLEEYGIVERQFLMHIFHQFNIEDKYTDMMIDVLIRKEILLACGEHKFRLMCKLPECEVSEIEPTGISVVLYATFKVFRAEYVFLHLLPRLDNIQQDRTFHNAAEFKESSKCRYVIRVRKANEKGPRFKIFESDVLKILIKCEDPFSALNVAFKIKAEIEQIFVSTRGTKANDNLINFGHLCMDCGALLTTSLDLGKEVQKIVPDIFHTVEVTKEKIIVTCTCKKKQD